MILKMENRIVLVIGGGLGVGKVMVNGLSVDGWYVVFIGWCVGLFEEIVGQIFLDIGNLVIWQICDVGDFVFVVVFFDYM